MAVKRRRWKRKQRAMMNRKAVKIMCKYCRNKDTCGTRKENKEKEERKGIITRCIDSSNSKPKYASWEKVNKNGEVTNVNKNGIPLNKWFFDETKKVKYTGNNSERKRAITYNSTKK